MKKSMFKTRTQKLAVIKFNGVSLVKEEIKLATFYEDNLNDFMETLIKGESNYPIEITYSGDAIKLHGNGSIRIDGTEYQITDTAFYQILNYLGIPIKFCSRLSNIIFVDLFNKMMSEQYENNLTVKIVADLSPQLIIGFHPERKMSLPTAFNLFSSLLKTGRMKARRTSFMAGVSCGLTYAMYLVFDDSVDFKKQMEEDYKGQAVWPGVEVLFSPIWEAKPTVTSCILSDDYVALNKGVSFKFDLKSTGMNKMSSALETFILNAKDGSEEMIDAFRASLSTEVSDKMNSLIHKRLPKVINSSLAGRNFVGMDMSKVLKEISGAGENQTLSQRRKTLFFVWDIIKEI